MSQTQALATVASDPLEFIATAVARGANPDELDKLLTLHERVTKAQAERAYAEAMRRCQEQMPSILKTATNKHTNTKYPLYENVLLVIKPIYTAAGFALSFGTTDSILPGYIRIICDVKHVGGHSEQYQGDFPADGQGSQGGRSGMNAVQGVGSTYTYARRYLTAMIFNLTVAGEDSDAATAAPENPKERADLLAAAREAYTAADLTPDEDAKFWSWLDVGNFSEARTERLKDALLNLQRKANQKKAGKVGAA